MRRITTISLALIAAMVCSVFLARSVGSLQVNPLATLFTNADGSPCAQNCLLGLVPYSAPEKIIYTLKLHPLSAQLGFDFDHPEYRALSGGGTVTVVGTNSVLQVGVYNNSVYNITLQLAPITSLRLIKMVDARRNLLGDQHWRASAGDILQLLGLPQSVGFDITSATPYLQYATYNYKSDRIQIAAAYGNNDSISPDDPFFWVRVEPWATARDVQTMATTFHARWLGFTSIQRYTEWMDSHLP